MKRHIALQPLSRQHHTGLLAVLLLKKGLARQASPQVMRRFVHQVWEEELVPHFEAEENGLLPAVKQPATEAVIQQLLQEHAQIRQVYQQLMADAPGHEQLSRFATLLEQHIRSEERVYFPALEPYIGPALAATLQHLEDPGGARCLLFEPKFWE